ncbi:MAG: leucine-rich repeat protein [Clostridia bacterium]|nr:leucine-rich repeat protein [Clostridia bacterium]
MKKTTKIVCGVIITAVVAGGTFTGLYYGVPGIRTEIDSIGQNTSQEIVKPDAPVGVKTSAKATSLTVEPIENAEYSLDGVIWQDSNVFTGLEPNTEYSIKVRLKQNGATPASDSTTIVATTSKYVVLQTPNVEAKQVEPTSITIESTDDFVEYSIDGVNYQSSPIFAGLAPNTTYLVYARTLETTTSYASEPKTLIITTPKYTQAEIPAISVIEINSSSITFNEIEGVEYSIDNGSNWQVDSTFLGLNPATTYTVLARFAETATHYVGDANSITITTEKTEQTAPVIECVEVTTDSITVTALENAEYSLDGVIWQDCNVFNGLNPATTYTIFAHYKETQTQLQSPNAEISITTDKTVNESTVDTKDVAIMNFNANLIELDSFSGNNYEYSLKHITDAGWVELTPWTSSKTINYDFATYFSNNPNGTILPYVRYPETSTTYASTEIALYEQMGKNSLIIDGVVYGVSPSKGVISVQNYFGTSGICDIAKSVTINGTVYDVECFELYFVGNECNAIITELSLPSTITSISVNTRSDNEWHPMKNIEKVYYNCNLEKSYGTTIRDESLFAGLGVNVESGCELIIGADVTTIPEKLLYYNETVVTSEKCNVTKITFEENSKLTTIGSYAFADAKCTTIDLPASVLTLGDYVFWDGTTDIALRTLIVRTAKADTTVFKIWYKLPANELVTVYFTDETWLESAGEQLFTAKPLSEYVA